jgi:hypothetical protein
LKNEKRKIDLPTCVNSNEGSLKELKRCFKVFLYFLSIAILYYKEGHVDEVKIIKSSDSKSLSNHPQTETPGRILSSPAEQCLDLPEKASTSHREFQPDIIRNLNMSPTASFLREIYIYTSSFNDSYLLALSFYY